MSESIVLERPLLPASGISSAGLKRRRVYIFPTRQGFLFAFTLVVMLLGAVNYTNSMAYLLTFLLASLFMVSMLHTFRNLRGLIIKLADAEPVFAGEAARFPMLFDNRSGYDRLALTVRPHPKRRDRGSGAVTALALDVRGGDLERVELEVIAARRGLFQLDRLLLSSTFPLGLFRAWSYLDTGPSCLVYPRPAGAAPLPPPQESESEHDTGQRAGTDDFTGFRTYRPGDSIRRIDWKALAREQGLLVKRFAGAGTRKLELRWTAVHPGADPEARLSQLCRWVLEAERLGIHYAVEIPGARVEHGLGTPHKNACLELLARYGA